MGAVVLECVRVEGLRISGAITVIGGLRRATGALEMMLRDQFSEGLEKIAERGEGGGGLTSKPALLAGFVYARRNALKRAF